MTIRLITIPLSHDCEKARWALERAGLPYQEEPHLQLFHSLASLREARTMTVPVLIYPGGTLTASSDILRWVDARYGCVPRLYPEAKRGPIQQLERQLDERLGPNSGLWMLHLLLPHGELIERYATYGIPGWQRVATHPSMLPALRWLLRARLGVTGVAAMAARREVARVLDDIAERLQDGRPFLMGDTFSAADLTFASLCAPLVLPAEYGIPLPRDEELPDAYRTQVETLRQHPAGAFALQLFRTQRRVVSAGV